MVLLANRFPRLISILTSAIFVSRTSGITSILKYNSVNPIIFYAGLYCNIFFGIMTECYLVFLSNTNNLLTVVWFQVISSVNDSYMISSNYFLLLG